MRYIIIDNYQSDWPTIVMNSMTSNKPIMFNSLEQAQLEANIHTDAIVVPLSKELMVWEDNQKWPDLPETDLTVYV